MKKSKEKTDGRTKSPNALSNGKKAPLEDRLNAEIKKHVEILKGKSVDVRWGAVDAPVQIGIPAVPTLIEVLKDVRWLVRWCAEIKGMQGGIQKAGENSSHVENGCLI